MAHIKVGGYYILDENNINNTKEYYPVKVRVMRRVGWRRYQCTPIEPVVYPCTSDGYALRDIIVDKKFLSPTTVDERIVIRTPLNMPTFSEDDMKTLDKLIEIIQSGGNVEKKDLARLKAISFKMHYTKEFN